MKIISKKISLLLVFLSSCYMENKPKPKIECVSTQGVVNPLIFKLLNLTGVSCDDQALASVVDVTQQHWLRKSGTERWDIENKEVPHQQEIYKICDQLGMFQEITPEHQNYEYAFILGALFSRMKVRLEYLIECFKQGVRFNSVVFLTGSRPANAAQGENQEALEQWVNSKIEVMPQTEAEILKFIYDHIQMPDEMRKIPIQIINVPMLQNPDSSFARPTTADTVEYWLKTNPKPGKILAISNQPYIWYQHSVMQTLLPNLFEVDTVGQGSFVDQKIGVLLDTLARILYQKKIKLQL